MACARPVPLLLAVSFTVFLACTTSSSSSPTIVGDYDDAAGMTIVDEAGSPQDCINAGGTCQTFQTPCPVLQQNTALCGDSLMICCLPPDDAAPYLPPIEAGGVDTGSPPMPEASPVEASSDAGGD